MINANVFQISNIAKLDGVRMEIKVKRTIAILLAVCLVLSLTATSVSAVSPVIGVILMVAITDNNCDNSYGGFTSGPSASCYGDNSH